MALPEVTQPMSHDVTRTSIPRAPLIASWALWLLASAGLTITFLGDAARELKVAFDAGHSMTAPEPLDLWSSIAAERWLWVAATVLAVVTAVGWAAYLVRRGRRSAAAAALVVSALAWALTFASLAVSPAWFARSTQGTGSDAIDAGFRAALATLVVLALGGWLLITTRHRSSD